MSRNGKTEPEFTPGAVRVVEDLGMTVTDVQRLGFRVVEHWSGVAAVSERDAYAISMRQRMISRQRKDENDRRSAEWVAAHPVLPGIPAQEPGMSAIEVMLFADAHEREPSVREQLLDAELGHGKRN